MVSIASLTRRVLSVTALQCLSHQTSTSLALTTRSPHIGRTRLQQIQPWRWKSHSCRTACAATTVSERTVETFENDVQGGGKLMQDMLYRIRDCNQMPDDLRSSIIDFQLNDCVLGKVDPKVAELLCSILVETTEGGPSKPVFELVTPSSSQSKDYLTLSEEACGATLESRSEAVAMVMESLKNSGVIKGWRDELYPVSDSFYNPPLFLMERAATDLLGVLSYGVHINGILQPDDDSNGELPLMWMARRSKTKSKYPSMLDHIVAGGQPEGLSLMENVIKECEEEAGIPPEIARPGVNLRPAGVVSYEESQKHILGSSSESFYTISRVVLFNYDLYLPKDFVPKPVDGEVEEFFLWRIDQIKESMAPDYDDPIKPNCYLVIIDYLLRMGFVSPETKGYLDVLQELRSGDCR